jgi:hypothetical protein
MWDNVFTVTNKRTTMYDSITEEEMFQSIKDGQVSKADFIAWVKAKCKLEFLEGFEDGYQAGMDNVID